MDTALAYQMGPDDEVGPFDHIMEPRKRAWLTAYAITGRMTRASAAAGLPSTTYRSKGWQEDAEFQAAKKLAEQIFADVLEDEAARRAREGLRRYKYDRGEVRRHPDKCDCGHDRRESHSRAVLEAVVTELADGTKEVTREEQEYWGPCLADGCTCDRFRGAPYYEDEYSDDLLKFLLRGARPEKYAERVQHLPPVDDIDWDALESTPAGQEVIRRFAAGENPAAVLASMAALGIQALRAPAVELGGPGTSNPVPPPPDSLEEGL